jgi:hypothetical protein
MDDNITPSQNLPVPTRKVSRNGGRPFGSKNRLPKMPRYGGRKDLIVPHEIADKFFGKMVSDITKDHGGPGEVSRVLGELIRAFCGISTLLQVRSAKIAEGKSDEVNVLEYTTLASTLLRYSMRLGLTKKRRDEPSLDEFLSDIKNRSINDSEVEQTGTIEMATSAPECSPCHLKITRSNPRSHCLKR